MGKSIRSKRKKALRTLKREKIAPAEQIKLKVLHEKLNDIVSGEREPKVEAIEPTEVKNPSKTTPYTFNFMVARKKQKAEEEMVDSNENNNNNNNDSSNNNTTTRRGRDRTVKPSGATAFLRNLQSIRESTGNLLPAEHEKKFNQINKSTQEKTTTNRPNRNKGRGKVKQEEEDVDMDSNNNNNNNGVLDEDSGMEYDEISYVSTGRAAHTRRSKLQKENRESQQRSRSKSRPKSKSAMLVKNWNKLK